MVGAKAETDETPKEPENFSFRADARQLQTALKGIAAFISEDDVRVALTGTHVTLTETHCRFEATNGFELYQVSVKRTDKGEAASFPGRLSRDELERARAEIKLHLKLDKIYSDLELVVPREPDDMKYPDLDKIAGPLLRARAVEWRSLNVKLLKNVIRALGDEQYIHVAIPRDKKAYKPVIFRRPIDSELDKDTVVLLMPMSPSPPEGDRRPTTKKKGAPDEPGK